MVREVPRFAGDIMRRDVVTLERGESIDQLDASMRALGYHHLPVVDEGRVVGIVSERDLLRATPAGPTIASAVMSRPVCTVDVATPLSEAARMLLDRRIGCLPVVDADGRLVGIVTTSDFVALSARLLERNGS